MFEGSTHEDAGEASGVGGGRAAWREVDRRLRVVAKRRSALDHEELALIRAAIEVALWRELGMVSMREYLEQVMGYGPNVASERIRVAESAAGIDVAVSPAVLERAASDAEWLEAEAIVRQCRATLENEMGERVDDTDLIVAMGTALLRGQGGGTGKAPNQIAFSVCPSCKVARQVASMESAHGRRRT